MFATLTSKVVRPGLVAALVMCAAAGSLQAEERVTFTTKQMAFTQGYAAYKGRHYELAIPALNFASQKGVVRATYYLARIFADNSGGYSDHARAYKLFREIVAANKNADPQDFRVARFVAKSLTAMARYHRDGLRALNLEPSTAAALELFDFAATRFDDEDAQFEIAKHYLSGDGVERNVRLGLNWLAKLSRRGHAGAQAFLASLYWDGRYAPKDPVKALALITVAVENAPEEERFWIEDVYQNIFCDAKKATRSRVRGVVAGWRKKFGRVEESAPQTDQLPGLGALTQRLCANGEVVPDLLDQRGSNGAVGPNKRGELVAKSVAGNVGTDGTPVAAKSGVLPVGGRVLKGSTSGF